jgi:hypothetical protein
LSVLTSTPTGNRVVFDEEVEELRDDQGLDYSGWYCVSTDPFDCPAPGCTFVARHLTAAHLIVVWPRKDDRALLSFANDAAKFGRNPKVVEYEVALGPCIPFDEWDRIGRPVHGMHDRGDAPFDAL